MKRKILIASFLKPVNDIRAYEKMALSIAKNNRYKVYCTGYPVKSEINNEIIDFVPQNPFKKNALGRIIARWKVFKIYIKLKPELIIVNSPDLLIITVLNKILFGGKIIYDLRENYFRNLWYQTNYPVVFRHLLAIAVRLRELVSSPFFNHFFLAEKVYINQLKFVRRKFTLLENKSLHPEKTRSRKFSPEAPIFLISGTIAKEYGLFEGIYFFKEVLSVLPMAKLRIAGHCPNMATRKKLMEEADSTPGIELAISTDPVPHQTIVGEILGADYGLLPYQPNKSTEGKWPTKLFEYMAYQLPIIIQANPVWDPFIQQTNSGISVDFQELNQFAFTDLLKQLNASEFYASTLPSEVFWDDEEQRLLSTLETLL